jgi:NAD(P)-dependent dehydrogenase (short-subunit alcohol dehydrogenase family)
MPTPSIHAFAEKVAVVTDAADPVGKAVAIQLALQGAYVVVGCSDPEAREALKELSDIGTLTSVVPTSKGSPDSLNDVFSAAASTFGRIDLLTIVGAAGSQPVASALQPAIALLETRPKPRVVFYDRVQTEGNADGLLTIVEHFASELPGKFRINGVVAGEPLKMAERSYDAELVPAREGRFPDEVARIIVFLLSGEASAIHGQVIKSGK